MHAPQQRIEQARDQRLGDSAEPETRQRHAELATGEVEIEAVFDVTGELGEDALIGGGIDVRGTGPDRRKLGGDEEAVHRDQPEGREDLPEGVHEP
jgi:hypothetical protein